MRQQIPVPPLETQRRIVAILDEAFADIAVAKVCAEKRLENARAVFDSSLEALLGQRREGRVDTVLGAEADLLVGFAFKSPQFTEAEDDVRLLRGDNIIQGALRWRDVKRWPAGDAASYKRYRLHTGDVVLAMDRPWVNAGLKRAQLSQSDLPCLLVQRTARLRGGRNLDDRYLFYLISSASFARHILGCQQGSGVPHISGQQIRDFRFAMPQLPEQRHIAARLDEVSHLVGNLVAGYQRQLAALDELKQSLLHQAFTGQLKKMPEADLEAALA